MQRGPRITLRPSRTRGRAATARAAPILFDHQVPRPAHRTQITKAVLALREAIFGGDFAPGERMSELPLVERLGVSRTPLRLALAELEHEGLLRGLPGGGYVVREFSQSDVRDAVELRGVLEGTAARFAAERGAPAGELAALRVINGRIGTLAQRGGSDAFERYLSHNEAFHTRLLALARSPLLERSLDRVMSLPFAAPSAFVLVDAELAQSRQIITVAHHQHLGILEAIEYRQGGRAESLTREHARLSLVNLDLVVRRREVLQRLPGAALIALPDPSAN
jgi:GntR family transcriptional regulator, vanillate catabolism transcriptional regulator